MFFWLEITILDIFYRFGDHMTINKIRHTRHHKLQPNHKVMQKIIIMLEKY